MTSSSGSGSAGRFEPGATIGMLGGGQLGRMFVSEAHRLGYRCVVRTDEPAGGPAAQLADGEIGGPYGDEAANREFATACDVVTAEFENLPPALLRSLAAYVPTRPHADALEICQHRRREKEFLRAHNIPHASFRVVTNAAEAIEAYEELGRSVVLKTAAFGYDGKGQVVIDGASNDDVATGFASLKVDEAVMEARIPFVSECSIVGARGVDGSWVCFGPGENTHRSGILDYTVAVQDSGSARGQRTQALARTVADALGFVGTIGVEFFVMADGSVLVNEIAPRPHNSGHHTIEAYNVSQFTLQVQAVTGQPLVAPERLTDSVMLNLLGDVWSGGEPRWELLASEPTAHLHLYGKAEARPGRKMGHLTVLAEPGESTPDLIARALSLRALLPAR